MWIIRTYLLLHRGLRRERSGIERERGREDGDAYGLAMDCGYLFNLIYIHSQHTLYFYNTHSLAPKLI